MVCPYHIILVSFLGGSSLRKGNPVGQWSFPQEYKTTSLQLKSLFPG